MITQTFGFKEVLTTTWGPHDAGSARVTGIRRLSFGASKLLTDHRAEMQLLGQKLAVDVNYLYQRKEKSA